MMFHLFIWASLTLVSLTDLTLNLTKKKKNIMNDISSAYQQLAADTKKRREVNEASSCLASPWTFAAVLMGSCCCGQPYRPQTNVRLVMKTLSDLSALLLFVCLVEKFEWESAARLGPRLCGAKKKNLETSLIINFFKIKKKLHYFTCHLSSPETEKKS